MVVPLLSIFVFFFSHAVSVVDAQLCLIMLLQSFYPCLSFMEDDMGLLGLPHFCLFLGLWACLLLLPAGLAPYCFLSFLWGLYSPLFLQLLTNLFSPPLFAGYWAFLLVGPFFIIKNGYQHTLRGPFGNVDLVTLFIFFGNTCGN